MNQFVSWLLWWLNWYTLRTWIGDYVMCYLIPLLFHHDVWQSFGGSSCGIEDRFGRKKMDNSFPKASEGFIVCKIAISTDESETIKCIEFLCFDWMTKFTLALYTLVCEIFCFASLSEKTYCFIISCIVSRRMQSRRFNAAYAWWQAQDLVDNTCCKSLLKLTLLFYQDLFDLFEYLIYWVWW